jgi:hypothetical protein
MEKKKTPLHFNISFKKRKSTKKEKSYKVTINEPFELGSPIKVNEPISVKMKENWVDRIAKFSALAAVLLAIGAIAFDYRQSSQQAESFNKFQEKLDSTLDTQLTNAKEQHTSTIATLQQQQIQNDSTIKLLTIQADRLKKQNEIWKINQQNKILSESVKIAPVVSEHYLKNDTVIFKLSYQNNGQRTAKDIKCHVGIFVFDKKNQISILTDGEAPMTMGKIIPRNSVNWAINKSFPERINNRNIYICSRLTYEDEFFKTKFVTTDFIRLFLEDNISNVSFCTLSEIDIIERNSHYKDIEIENYTIKDKYLFK